MQKYHEEQDQQTQRFDSQENTRNQQTTFEDNRPEAAQQNELQTMLNEEESKEGVEDEQEEKVPSNSKFSNNKKPVTEPTVRNTEAGEEESNIEEINNSFELAGFAIDVVREKNKDTGETKVKNLLLKAQEISLLEQGTSLPLIPKTLIPIVPPAVNAHVFAELFADMKITIKEAAVFNDEEQGSKINLQVPVNFDGTAGIRGGASLSLGIPLIANIEGQIALEAALNLQSRNDLMASLDTAKVGGSLEELKAALELGLMGNLTLGGLLSIIGSVDLNILFFEKNLYSGTIGSMELPTKELTYGLGDKPLDLTNTEELKSELSNAYSSDDVKDMFKENEEHKTVDAEDVDEQSYSNTSAFLAALMGEEEEEK